MIDAAGSLLGAIGFAVVVAAWKKWPVLVSNAKLLHPGSKDPAWLLALNDAILSPLVIIAVYLLVPHFALLGWALWSRTERAESNDEENHDESADFGNRMPIAGTFLLFLAVTCVWVAWKLSGHIWDECFAIWKGPKPLPGLTAAAFFP